MAVELKLDVLINRYLLGNLALVTMEPTYCKNWSCELPTCFILYYYGIRLQSEARRGSHCSSAANHSEVTDLNPGVPGGNPKMIDKNGQTGTLWRGLLDSGKFGGFL